MNPNSHVPFNPSNGSQSENQSTPHEGVSNSTSLVEEDDCDFSDGVLRYIDQMLMEEDADEQTHMLQESLAFQAKERSFYAVLGKKYPHSPQQESGINTHTDYDDVHFSGGEPLVINDDVLAPKENELLGEIYVENHIENSHCQEEGRSKKVAAVSTEYSDGPVDEFDNVLLSTVGDLENKSEESYTTTDQKISKGDKKELIDLETVLMDCAKAIAAGDQRAANDWLKQIRQHSSVYGDGTQRLAHYFADALEARLAGTGTQIFEALVNKRTTAFEYMKAFYACITSCPFKNVSIFVSNKIITVKSRKAMRVHIIDFGILYGFQWPALIQGLAEREGGPPRLRITGIDFPQPGFRPAERVEETGRRLARYAETFNVPFEYNAVAQDWETIKVEDLKLEKGEFVAVNCLYRAQNLQDEAGVNESSRTEVLKLIRNISPDIFVHVTLNGGYGLPSFLSRFREALYHFSAVFDLGEKVLPREKLERLLIERDIFGKEALNVIACEGWERVERPEVYTKWQYRHVKAGFKQVHLERKMVEDVIKKVKKSYHKDFSICVDNQWLLQSWKGRIMFAISCWKPAS